MKNRIAAAKQEVINNAIDSNRTTKKAMHRLMDKGYVKSVLDFWMNVLDEKSRAYLIRNMKVVK